MTSLWTTKKGQVLNRENYYLSFYEPNDRNRGQTPVLLIISDFMDCSPKTKL
jgi:hypothetical protein